MMMHGLANPKKYDKWFLFERGTIRELNKK
jgi:hypothetical protein